MCAGQFRVVSFLALLVLLSCTPKVLHVKDLKLPKKLSIKPICANKLLHDIQTAKATNEPVAKALIRMPDEDFCQLFTEKEIRDLIFAFEAEIDRWGYELVPYPQGAVILSELERGHFGLRFRASLVTDTKSEEFINYHQTNHYRRVRFGDIVYEAFARLDGNVK